MLMVIFGAGASYDSVPSRPPSGLVFRGMQYRPPLANELFGDREFFETTISRFPECQPIIPRLRHPPKDMSVEQVLEHLQDDGQNYPTRYRQLAAIRYYLHFMLWECEHEWSGQVAKGVSNYKTLLDDIERWRKPEEQVCLVTFNYDRLLEQDLPAIGVHIKELGDYVANANYKIIKLHGSVNWAREVDSPIEIAPTRNEWDIAYELIERAAELTISQRYRIVDGRPIARLQKEQVALFPAVALPLERKRDYECPPDHLDALRAFIPAVTKILIIGWRATEIPFLRLLGEKLRHGVAVMIVSGGHDGAREVSQRLAKAGIIGDFFLAKGGFTDFVVNREVDEFFKS